MQAECLLSIMYVPSKSSKLSVLGECSSHIIVLANDEIAIKLSGVCPHGFITYTSYELNSLTDCC